MSHTPTIHPTDDGHVEVRVDGLQVAVLPDRDAETLGQALADLYGLTAQEPTQRPLTTATCRTCGGPIEYVTEMPPAYWRHVGLMGDPHGAAPAEIAPARAQSAAPPVTGGDYRTVEDDGLDHGADALPDGAPL